MQIEELEKKIQTFLEEAYSMVDTLTIKDDAKNDAKRITAIISDYVAEIIGEDSNISYHLERGVEYLHEYKDSRMWEHGYNKAKEEMRTKAGLSSIEEKT